MKRLLILVMLVLPMTIQAGIDINQFSSAKKEAIYGKLVYELRCLVCQNQNLADSNAELAIDLRNEVFKMVEAGSSKQDVVDFMVARYGDFVLYRPPMQANTSVLWIGPFLILAVGIAIALIFVRRHRLSADDDDSLEDNQ
ncbi:MAG TPA: cytochrome c-type biogenesis protein CcmH [Gammaproteobacteria bacterium]|nr:cytochrome c-type biogenesis protein CcmH [Gammaproteobacteria bacterium]